MLTFIIKYENSEAGLGAGFYITWFYRSAEWTTQKAFPSKIEAENFAKEFEYRFSDVA